MGYGRSIGTVRRGGWSPGSSWIASRLPLRIQVGHAGDVGEADNRWEREELSDGDGWAAASGWDCQA